MLIKEFQAVATIAYRDFTKLLRDRFRMAGSLVFPLIFVGVLGGGLNASLAGRLPFEYMPFIFVGIFAQTMFQSAAAGVISLIQDRENDFSKELFVAPVSRYSIIVGKIFGESLVAMTQGVGIIILGLIFGVPLPLVKFLTMIPIAFLSAIVGGAFGIVLIASASDQRTAGQFFPFLIFPQLFLSGVFNPVQDFPAILKVLSHLTPIRYIVDLMRSVYYAGTPEYSAVVANTPLFNSTIIALLLIIFLTLGTWLFIRKERNR